MKYLLVLNVNPDVIAALPEEEQQAIGSGHQKFMDTIKASGEFHSTVALQQPAQSAVVRVRNGLPAVTDGPSPGPWPGWSGPRGVVREVPAG